MMSAWKLWEGEEKQERRIQKLTVALMKRTTTPGASEPLEEEKESKREAN